MKVALINPNWNERKSSETTYNRKWIPLSLVYSASLLRDNNIKPLLIDAHTLNLCVDKIVKKVKDYDKIFITTSPYDRWQCPDINIDPALKLFKALINKECYVIGTHVTLNPEKILKLTKAKAGIVGSPEFSILEICKNEDLQKVNNLVLIKNNQLIKTKKKSFGINNFPIPTYDLLNPNNYEYEIFGKKFALVETARGCVYKCKFCYKDMFGKYSEMDIDKVIESLKRLVECGFETAYFMDLNFLTDKERTKKLCREMVKNKIKLMWCCQSRIDNLDGETINLMKKSGCELIHVGIEIASNKMQKKMNKNINLNRTKKNIKLLKKNKIKFVCFILLGIGEKRGDVNKTKKFIMETKPNFISVHNFRAFDSQRTRKITLDERINKMRLLMMNLYFMERMQIIKGSLKKINIFINNI